MMNKPPEIFQRIYRRHGHRCPMSTLGGRMGLAAAARMPGAKELRVLYFAETCALDGIRETTGCTEGEGTLRVENRGEHRLRVHSPSGGMEIVLSPAALELAWSYRLCSEVLERDRHGLDPQARTIRERECARVLEEVLQQLWTLADDVLLEIRETHPTEAAHA